MGSSFDGRYIDTQQTITAPSMGVNYHDLFDIFSSHPRNTKEPSRLVAREQNKTLPLNNLQNILNQAIKKPSTTKIQAEEGSTKPFAGVKTNIPIQGENELINKAIILDEIIKDLV